MESGETAEGRLLRAATRVPFAKSDDVELALRSGPDWTRLVEAVLHHRLARPMLDALASAGPSLVPGDLLAALAAHCETLDQQTRTLLTELWAILAELESRGVDAVPFKGPLLADIVFSDFTKRAPGDIDLLIRPEKIGVARAVLEDLGYADADARPSSAQLSHRQREMYERSQCEYRFTRRRDNIVVEPHWELSQHPLAIDVDFSGLLDRARPFTLQGRSVLALTPEDLLTALCVHGSKHYWARLAWVRDIGGVLHRFPGIDLSRVLKIAHARGYARLILLSLELAREYAGADLPQEIVRAVESDRHLVCLVKEIDHRLFDFSAAEPRNDRIEPFRLRMRERWSDRARYVVRTLISPRRHHIETVDLPRSLCWCYYPLKVGIDYAISPGWKLFKWGRSVPPAT